MLISLKVILCGDGSVGKTSLRRSYMGQAFKEQYLMTLGADLSVKSDSLKFQNKVYTFKYSIWDLAGQSTFERIRPKYYEGAHAIILVYDIINRSSFENITHWLKEIDKTLELGTLPIVLVANKNDLRKEHVESLTTEVEEELVRNLSSHYTNSEWTIPFIETSALTGNNVNSVFAELGKLVLKLYK